MNNQPTIQSQPSIYFNSVNSYSQVNETEKVDFLTTQQLYNAVFENAFHPMYIESDDGRIIRFNEKLATLFQYPKWQMGRNDSSDLFNVNEDCFIDFLQERNEKGIAKAEITGIKKSGVRFPCRISSVNYKTDDGCKRSMNTIVDISKSIEARWNLAG
jgi:PAS domain S-box-containing protein